MIKTTQPALHGVQHLADGSDPIPGIVNLPADAAAGNYPVLIAALPDLRGYWRLGESASPFLDTSGYVGTPADLTYNTGAGGSTPATLDVTPGLLPVATDDGAIGFNEQGNTSSGSAQKPYLAEPSTAASRFDFPTSAAFSVVARIKPYTPGATAFVGGIISHVSSQSGQPLSGWGLHVSYPSIQPAFFRGINPSTMTTVNAPAIDADEAHTLVATYDGTTSRLYVDGVLAASSADANTLTASPHSSTRIRVGGYDPMRPSFGDWRPFYGVTDEVAVYGTALTADQVAALHAASLEGIPDGWVPTSDGEGGITWGPPAAPTGTAGGVLDGSYPNPGLAATVAGAGLAETSDVLSVNVDGSTIEINLDTLRVKADGITANEIAAGAVGSSELASTAVAAATYGDATHVPQFTVDADGRITNASSVTITGSSGIGEILITDTPSTPLVFADLIQNEAQDDLVYADP